MRVHTSAYARTISCHNTLICTKAEAEPKGDSEISFDRKGGHIHENFDLKACTGLGHGDCNKSGRTLGPRISLLEHSTGAGLSTQPKYTLRVPFMSITGLLACSQSCVVILLTTTLSHQHNPSVKFVTIVYKTETHVSPRKHTQSAARIFRSACPAKAVFSDA